MRTTELINKSKNLLRIYTPQPIKKIIKRSTNIPNISSSFIDSRLSKKILINHEGQALTFSTPNYTTRIRALTFSTKEPETLKWIQSFEKGSCFWDIGANVGIYTIYAAKIRQCIVYAFECSPFNIEWLARNVFLNKQQDKIYVVSLPLSDKKQSSLLKMKSTKWGGAMNSFAVDYTHDGSTHENNFCFSTVGITMDEAMQFLDIKTPDYIKLDVDGIEHLILRGGKKVLSETKGVLVEVNEVFKEQLNNCTKYLTEAGLVLSSKHRWKDTAIFNQIWQRPS